MRPLVHESPPVCHDQPRQEVDRRHPGRAADRDHQPDADHGCRRRQHEGQLRRARDERVRRREPGRLGAAHRQRRRHVPTQLVGRQSLLAGASDGTTDYLLGAEGGVFSTATGGQAGAPTTLTLKPSVKAITKADDGHRSRSPHRSGRRRARHRHRQRFRLTGHNGRRQRQLQLSFRLKTTTFVAYWGGNGVRQGDGSSVVSVLKTTNPASLGG